MLNNNQNTGKGTCMWLFPETAYMQLMICALFKVIERIRMSCVGGGHQENMAAS